MFRLLPHGCMCCTASPEASFPSARNWSDLIASAAARFLAQTRAVTAQASLSTRTPAKPCSAVQARKKRRKGESVAVTTGSGTAW